MLIFQSTLLLLMLLQPNYFSFLNLRLATGAAGLYPLGAHIQMQQQYSGISVGEYFSSPVVAKDNFSIPLPSVLHITDVKIMFDKWQSRGSRGPPSLVTRQSTQEGLASPHTTSKIPPRLSVEGNKHAKSKLCMSGVKCIPHLNHSCIPAF